MCDTEMSPSILDCNGLLVTEKANKEPDQKVEDELLQSASEDEDKDNQPPIPLNELTYKRTKKSEQKTRRKRPHVKQTRDSHIRENPTTTTTTTTTIFYYLTISPYSPGSAGSSANRGGPG